MALLYVLFPCDVWYWDMYVEIARIFIPFGGLRGPWLYVVLEMGGRAVWFYVCVDICFYG